MRIFNKLRFLINSFLWGLRNADRKMLSQVSNGDGSGIEINTKLEKAGTLAEDLINKQETERVQEFRDEQYRVYRESGKYKIDTSSLEIKDGMYVIPEDYHLEKKETTNKIPEEILNIEGETLLVVQNNYPITEGLEDALNDLAETAPVRYKVKVESDDFRRFKIEKYTKLIAVKKDAEDNTFVEFYCSIFPREFVVMKGQREKGTIDKSDVFFIQEAEAIVSGKTTSDIFNFSNVEFSTEHAYNKDDLYLYKYINNGFVSCHKHQMNFVFRFKAIPVMEGYDMIEKYRKDSVDEKYNTKAQKTTNFELNELTMPKI